MSSLQEVSRLGMIIMSKLMCWNQGYLGTQKQAYVMTITTCSPYRCKQHCLYAVSLRE